MEEVQQSSNVKNFEFNYLKNATPNFCPDSMLGEGGFGCVFKGWIDGKTFAASKCGTGLVIAVKRLNHNGSQGHQEWLVGIHFFHIDSSYFFSLVLFFVRITSKLVK